MAERVANRLCRMAQRYPIDETLVLGIDVGIASTGSAVVRHEDPPSIAFLGSRCFEASEVTARSGRELKNKTRRDKRLGRRTTRRRAKRMEDVRRLLADAGFPPPAGDPWQARIAGLDRRLEDAALAAALVHLAKHRGFKSTRKSAESPEEGGEEGRLLSAITANRELMAADRALYRSIGELLVKSERFRDGKRNRDGAYKASVARDGILQEARLILGVQRTLGCAKLTADFEAAYLHLLSFQELLPDSEDSVGFCPFEPTERRAPRHARPSSAFAFSPG